MVSQKENIDENPNRFDWIYFQIEFCIFWAWHVRACLFRCLSFYYPISKHQTICTGKNDENRYIIDLFLQEHLYLFRELFSHNLRVDLTAHVVYIYIYLRAYTTLFVYIIFIKRFPPPTSTLHELCGVAFHIYI